jgi:hypothetical protein
MLFAQSPRFAQYKIKVQPNIGTLSVDLSTCRFE